jgi:hypothetical protein
MGIVDRLMTAAIGAIVACLALTLALLLVFVAGPVGLAAGVVGLIVAPLLTLRVTGPFTKGGALLSARAMCAAMGIAVTIVGGAPLLGLAITRGDAYDSAWLVLAYAAVCMAGAVGPLWPRSQLTRRS